MQSNKILNFEPYLCSNYRQWKPTVDKKSSIVDPIFSHQVSNFPNNNSTNSIDYVCLASLRRISPFRFIFYIFKEPFDCGYTAFLVSCKFQSSDVFSELRRLFASLYDLCLPNTVGISISNK